MSMKKILMAAVAVSAIGAGSANALAISNAASSVGGITLAPTSGTVAEAFTIASESQITAATNIPMVLNVTPTGTLLQGNSYIVTYTISGGTFETSGIGTTDLSTLGNGNSVASTGEVSATKIQYVITSAAAGGTNVTIPSILWTSKGIIPSVDKTPVTVTVSLANNNSPSQVIDGGAKTATVIDFRQGLTFTADAAVAQTLSIASGFKKFGTASATAAADTVSVKIGSGVKFALVPAATTALASDVVYKVNGALIAPSDVTAASLVIGGSLTGLDARVGSSTTSQLADATTGLVAVLNTTNLASLVGSGASVYLQQKATAVVPSEGTYTVKPQDVVMASGLLAGTYSAKTMGTVGYEGTNFFAAWITDGAGTSGFKNTIRLGNRSATAIASVKASLLNPLVPGTSGTVASTATCEVGPLPASGELLIKSETLTACFGKFGRSDVRLTIQGNASDMVAKLRITSPDGSASDTALGTGVADAAQ